MGNLSKTLGTLSVAATLAGTPAEAETANFQTEIKTTKLEIFENLSTTENPKSTISREQAETMTATTPWGKFLTNELGNTVDKNTEETIQKYFGALPEIIQEEVKSLLKTNKNLFFDLENTMYGIGILLSLISKEQLIDKD